MAGGGPMPAADGRVARVFVSRRLRSYLTLGLLLLAALAAGALAGLGEERVRVKSGSAAPGGPSTAGLADLRVRSDALAAELAALRAELESRLEERERDSAALGGRLDDTERGLRVLESRLSPGGSARPGPPGPSADVAPILERLYQLELRHDSLERTRESFERDVLGRLHKVEAIRDRAESERLGHDRAMLERIANVEARLYGVEAGGADAAPPVPASIP